MRWTLTLAGAVIVFLTIMAGCGSGAHPAAPTAEPPAVVADWCDQVRAAEWLASHPGPVVLVNQATPRVCELYARLGFDVGFLAAPRRISCTGDRTPAREIIATRHV